MGSDQIILTIILSIFILVLLFDLVTTNQALYLTGAVTLSVLPLVSANLHTSELISTSVNPIIILLITLGILAKISETSRLTKQLRVLIAKYQNPSSLLALIIFTSSILSAFLNNALVVSVMIPLIGETCRSRDWDLKSFLIPLSFSSMLGGTMTMIGSSTNLVAKSLLASVLELKMFSLTLVSASCLLVGNLYLWTISKCYFNKHERTSCYRRPDQGVNIGLRLFKIPELSYLIGKTISDADILSLGEYQLCGIQTGHNFLGRPPRKNYVLGLHDVLIYLGANVDEIPCSDRAKLDGLTSIDNTHISDQVTPNIAVGTIPRRFSDLPGSLYGDIHLKHNFGLVLLAVSRNNTLLRHQLGRTRIQPGDKLIVYGNYPETSITCAMGQFCQRVRMISTRLNPNLDRKLPIVHEIILWGSFIVIVSLGSVSQTDINAVALVVGIFLYLSQIISETTLSECLYQQRSLVLGIIVSLVISGAIQQTGLTSYLAKPIQYLPHFPTTSGIKVWGSLVLVHLASSCASLVLSNISVVAVMIPIFRDLYLDDLDSLYLLATAVLHGASSCFAAPAGYHTNLMVSPVAGYSCRDFLVVGLPLHLITSVTFATVTYFYYG